MKTLLTVCVFFAGCGATHAWFTSSANQVQVAAGCEAMKADDAALNLLAVQFAPRQEVVAAINTVHAAIQEGLAACEAKAAGK